MKRFLFLLLLAAIMLNVRAQQETTNNAVYFPEKVVKATYFDKTAPLRNITPIVPGERKRAWKNDLVGNKTVEDTPFDLNGPENLEAIDPVVQDYTSQGDYWPLRNIMGLGNVNSVFPADTDGDVGPDHYFLMINLSFAIYNKAGVMLYGPADNSTLWNGFIGPWTGTNDGDPIVVYDELADRWFASQFAVNTSNNTFWELVAISETGDPLGAWYRYAFQFNYFNDYPKFGVWHNAYIGTFNYFNASATSYIGGGAVALERDAMLAGNPDARMIMFPISNAKYGILPADIDGTPPPSNEPAWFAHINRTGNKKLEIWKADLNWDNPSSSTYQMSHSLTVEAFNASVSGVPQPNTTQLLDAIGGQLMFRLQYRNFGTYQTLVANHTVTANARASIRWYELRKTDADWSIYQQGTFSPDTDSRWMGSIAMNGKGHIALGYSVSSATTYPGIRYTGRTADAPLGTFNMPETDIIIGASAQTNVNRWGDYSAMSVDPSDDSTFWYTQMYRLGGNWRTQIASFDFAPGVGPQADAGEDIYICTDQNFVTTGGSGIAVQNVLWTSNGDGMFLYTDRLQTLYAPGFTDRDSGLVTLNLQITGWNGEIVSDDVDVIIYGLPLAVAGNDTIVCIGYSVDLAGQALFADSIVWQSAGDGFFNDINLLNANYTPGLQDISAGAVELSLHAFANSVCIGESADYITLTMDDCTSIPETNSLAEKVNIIPNPNNGIFTLRINENQQKKLIWFLTNNEGKTIKRSTSSPVNGIFYEVFDMQSAPKGIYFLHLSLGKEKHVEKIVIR